MNDFEARLKQLLNEDVDARLGDPRPAPPQRFAAPASGRHAQRRTSSRFRTRWLPPLIAAAVIAVVLAGTAAAGELLSSSDRRVDPATVVPSTTLSTVPPPTSSVPRTASSTPTTPATTRPVDRTTTRPVDRTTGASTPTTQRTESGPELHTVKFGQATIVLPQGWVSRDLVRYGGGSSAPPARCLTPTGVPVADNHDACPVILTALGSDTASIYPDHDGANLSVPVPCGKRQKSVSQKSGSRQLGGRRAVWHHWDYNCTGRADVQDEQYVIAAVPAYILYSSQADRATAAVMATIAAKSTLPG